MDTDGYYMMGTIHQFRVIRGHQHHFSITPPAPLPSSLPHLYSAINSVNSGARERECLFFPSFNKPKWWSFNSIRANEEMGCRTGAGSVINYLHDGHNIFHLNQREKVHLKEMTISLLLWSRVAWPKRQVSDGIMLEESISVINNWEILIIIHFL